MADRNTLSVKKLNDFSAWLISKGWTLEPTRGCYEVLRARKPDRPRPLIVYKRLSNRNGSVLTHLTVDDMEMRFVREFLKECADNGRIHTA